MPCKLRVEYPGAFYHAMSRGDRCEADLAARRKGDAEKMALAARLRKETTLSVKAIAARVHLGTAKSANVRLHEWRQKGKPAGGAGTLQLGL
jgi:hypothetical protein